MNIRIPKLNRIRDGTRTRKGQRLLQAAVLTGVIVAGVTMYVTVPHLNGFALSDSERAAHALYRSEVRAENLQAAHESVKDILPLSSPELQSPQSGGISHAGEQAAPTATPTADSRVALLVSEWKPRYNAAVQSHKLLEDSVNQVIMYSDQHFEDVGEIIGSMNPNTKVTMRNRPTLTQGLNTQNANYERWKATARATLARSQSLLNEMHDMDKVITATMKMHQLQKMIEDPVELAASFTGLANDLDAFGASANDLLAEINSGN